MVGPAAPPPGKCSASSSSSSSPRGDFKLHHRRASSILRRRTTAGILPALELPPKPAAAPNGGLHHWPNDPPAGYTSLRDLLSSPGSAESFVSPSTPSAASDIRIRNRLVKHAAYAYLQPTPSATDAPSSSIRRRGAAALLFAWDSCLGFLLHLLGSLRR